MNLNQKEKETKMQIISLKADNIKRLAGESGKVGIVIEDGCVASDNQ